MVASATLWTDLARLDAVKQALADAKARAASSYATLLTNGTGVTAPGTPFSFGTSFIGEPAVLSGTMVKRLPGAGWQMPRVTAGVYNWVRDSKGLYTGAYLYFAVDCPPIDDTAVPINPANPAVVHHLVFQAIGFTGQPAVDSALDTGLAHEQLSGGTAT